jgi:hypothetical protein
LIENIWFQLALVFRMGVRNITRKGILIGKWCKDNKQKIASAFCADAIFA